MLDTISFFFVFVYPQDIRCCPKVCLITKLKELKLNCLHKHHVHKMYEKGEI